ncbi:hypothetical protein D3C81_2212690 [compost metagenome]
MFVSDQQCGNAQLGPPMRHAAMPGNHQIGANTVQNISQLVSLLVADIVIRDIPVGFDRMIQHI